VPGLRPAAAAADSSASDEDMAMDIHDTDGYRQKPGAQVI
jgi:hypothetical protein